MFRGHRSPPKIRKRFAKGPRANSAQNVRRATCRVSGSVPVLLQAGQSVERVRDRLRAVEVVAERGRRVKHRLHQRQPWQRQSPLARGVGNEAQVLADQLDEEAGAPVVRDYLRAQVAQLPRVGPPRAQPSPPCSASASTSAFASSVSATPTWLASLVI